MPYGRKVIKQNGKKTEFSFEAHQDVVGEIRLEKNPNDMICNVCLSTETLTIDHVPPQSTGNRGQWKYQSYLNYVTSPNYKKQFTANGIGWTTVCRNCHDKIGRFDPQIGDLFSRLKAQYKARGRPYMPITFCPNAVIRGTLLHFLSAKTYHHRTTEDDLFYELLVDDLQQIPQDYHFYVFPFMQKEIRVFNGIAFPILAESIAIVHCIKIFPLAFVFSDKPFPIDGLLDWSQFFAAPPDKEIDLQFGAIMPIDDNFPERYTFTGMQLLGHGAVESVIAWPRK